MSETIWVSIISAAATVLGVLIANKSQQKLMMAEFDKKLALLEQKIQMLTAEVKEHNNYARRMPVLEEQIKELQKRA